MIFVILGTQKFQLNRLLKEIDEMCSENLINEDVFAQIGNSDYKPTNYNFTQFLDKAEFDEMIAKSSVVITHSGVGSIITALKSKKPVVVFPRLSKYKEHVDDHQLEIAEAFEKKKYVLCYKEGDNLVSLVEQAREYTFEEYVSAKENIVNIIRNYVERSN